MLWPDLSEHGLTVFAKSPTSVVVMPIDPDGSLEDLEDIPGIVNEAENSKTLDVMPNAQFWVDRFQAARFRWVPASRVLREENSPNRALWYWKVDTTQAKDALDKLGLNDVAEFPDGLSIYVSSETAAKRVHSDVSRVNADEVEVMGINPAARRVLYGRPLSESGQAPIVLPLHKVHQDATEAAEIEPDPLETRAEVLPEDTVTPDPESDEAQTDDEAPDEALEPDSPLDDQSGETEGSAAEKTRREDYGRYIPMARKMMFSVSEFHEDNDDTRKAARKMLTTRLSRNTLWPESSIMALAENPDVSTASLLLAISMRESMSTSYSVLIPVRSRRRSGYKYMSAEAILAGGVSWATNTLRIKQIVEESAIKNDLLIDGLPWASLAQAAFDNQAIIYGKNPQDDTKDSSNLDDPANLSRRLSRLSGKLIGRPYSDVCDYAGKLLARVPKTDDGLIDLNKVMALSEHTDRDDLLRMVHEYAETIDMQNRYGVQAHSHGIAAVYVNAAIRAQSLIREIVGYELMKQYTNQFPALPLVEVENSYNEMTRAMRRCRNDPTSDNLESEKKSIAAYLAQIGVIIISIGPTMELAEKILGDIASKQGVAVSELIRSELVKPYGSKTRTSKKAAEQAEAESTTGMDDAAAEDVAEKPGKPINPYALGGEMPIALPEDTELARDSSIDWRKGEHVTEEAICTRFGFSGIQYGNYVTQKERQSMLNDCYDALADMAYALDLPDRFMGIDGKLALAFGARGRGGRNAAMAHYEPSLKVINFTKKRGAGTLAHELSHGWDNHFGSLNGVTYLSESRMGATQLGGMDKFVDSYLHYRASDVGDDWQEYRKRLSQDTNKLRDMAFIQFTDRMFSEAYMRKQMSTYSSVDLNQWPQRIKPFMDWIKENPMERLLSGRTYSARDLKDVAAKKVIEAGHPEFTEAEKTYVHRWLLKAFPSVKKLFNEVINAQGSSAVASAISKASNSNMTLFGLSGLILDANKKEKDMYWSTGREYYARAASSVIHYQMALKGVRNDWASGISEPSAFSSVTFIASPNIEREFGELERAHEAFMTHLLPEIQALAVDMVGPRENFENKATTVVDLAN